MHGTALFDVDLISNPKPRSTFPAKPPGASTSLLPTVEAPRHGLSPAHRNQLHPSRVDRLSCWRRTHLLACSGVTTVQLGRKFSMGFPWSPVPLLDRNEGDMRSLLAVALLLGVAAACSKQPAATAVPAPSADPKAAATIPAKPAATTAPNANDAPVILGAPGSAPNAKSRICGVQPVRPAYARTDVTVERERGIRALGAGRDSRAPGSPGPVLRTLDPPKRSSESG